MMYRNNRGGKFFRSFFLYIFQTGGGLAMTAVRDFLVAFGISAVGLMDLVSFVFLGSTLMNEFTSLTDIGAALSASAVLSALLAVPMAAAGASYSRLGLNGEKAA